MRRYLDRPEKVNNRRWDFSQHDLRWSAGGLQQRLWQAQCVRPFLLTCLQGSGLRHRLRLLSGEEWEKLRIVRCMNDWPTPMFLIGLLCLQFIMMNVYALSFWYGGMVSSQACRVCTCKAFQAMQHLSRCTSDPTAGLQAL